ncbi:MAG: phage antirepressor [Peptostreptococcus sp.]|uniref:phage antirepressor n=1 Tax=Peptostreptococcus sp. TaxID=1262 RepID=UPI002909B903|nr:phage antirepressor [Peptostreptococcus sp.]MDU5349991.1 phage antirepressor [Peptostreptococcus sp.]MDU5891827.1 phage antirepressor [Peptostreptococcus sp.]
MNNELMVFQNKEFGEVRSVMIDGEPWFMLFDVCRILDIKNSRQAKARLREDDVISNDVIDSVGRNQKADFINESNLYKLVFQSRKPQAERFANWVTSEVLPSIRKHGAYLTPDKVEEVLLNPDTLIQLAQNLKVEQEKRRLLEAENKELKPKATYCERVLMSNEAVTTTQISKDYGMTAQELNQILHEQNVQFKTGGQWLLYRQHQGKGLTESETYIDRYGKSYMSTKWTQKGRLFIYEILSNIGIYPNEEKEIKRPKKKQIKTGNKINYRDSLFDKLYNLYMAKQINKGQFAKCCSITTPTLNKMIKKYEENVGMN